MSKRADRHLTPAAESIDDGAFGSQCHSGTRIADGRDQFSRAIVALSNLDGNDALTRCRHAELDWEQGGDARSPIQTSKSGCGQHECIIVAGVQFPEPRIEVSSNRQELPG